MSYIAGQPDACHLSSLVPASIDCLSLILLTELHSDNDFRVSRVLSFRVEGFRKPETLTGEKNSLLPAGFTSHPQGLVCNPGCTSWGVLELGSFI